MVVSIFKFQFYKELCKHDPSVKPQTNVDFQSFDKVLDALQNKVIDVSLLKEMSDAFDWDYQKVLVTQVSSFSIYLSKVDVQEKMPLYNYTNTTIKSLN